MFSKKATKFDKIFAVNLTLCSNYQIEGEDFVNFCGLLRKHELYLFASFYKLVILLKKANISEGISKLTLKSLIRSPNKKEDTYRLLQGFPIKI